MTRSLHLALDLGTTTLAGRLLDGQGQVLAEGKVANPQRALGADIVRRLEAALAGEGERLQALLVEGINALLDELLHAAGAGRAALTAAAAAANPGVTALLAGDDLRPILFPPHRPRNLSLRILDLPALQLPVPLTLFPLLSGYVGGDLVACLYGLDSLPPFQGEGRGGDGRTILVIDLGTNGEIALGGQGGWLATSVPAGPAFEGGEISCGQLATQGAISNVSRSGDRLQLEVIGNGAPTGLAGSGLFAVIAVAIDSGLIDRSGRIVSPAEVDSNLSRYLRPDGQAQALCLYRDARREIVVTQGDIRAFQLAKGAVRAGIDALLARADIAVTAVEQVIVTGAFGLSLNRQSLKSVAILPAVMVEKALFIPGGALAGVQRFLLQSEGAAQLQALTAKMRSYPLSGTPAFERAFLAALDF
ncbi:MAG: DUF4445 domain-containing protein [Desulfuromonadales bacterium]|nr:DUF4445 domain-containing protein [Desulfuromonadales bacterium]